MDISNLKSICMGCMEPLSKPDGFCTRCGWNNAISNNQPHQLPIFTVLNGKYIVGRALGQGGFGITYVGMDLYLDTKVAIKEFYPETCVSREGVTSATVMPYSGEKGEYFAAQREKFVGEAKLLAKLADKRSIVHVRDFFRENGTAYIVMEYVEGTTLKDIIKREGGRLRSAYLLNLLKPIMEDLAAIHAQNLIHRDISPDNIMVQPNGEAKLLDFGAARETDYAQQKSMTVNVKHGFAPEEQYRTHGAQGPWTDIYAMCATLYHAATGTIPAQSVDRMHEDTLIAPNGLGADFTPRQQNAIMRGLALKAEERFRSFYDLMGELYAEMPAPQAGVAGMAGVAGAAGVTGAYPASQTGRTYGASSADDGKTVPVSGGDNGKPPTWADAPQKPKKKLGLILGIAAGGVAIIVAAVLILSSVSRDNSYSQALSLLAGGDYQAAQDKFAALPDDYEDADLLEQYAKAQALLKAQDYIAARDAFEALGDFKDAKAMIGECDYQRGSSLMGAGQYEAAIDVFKALGGYQDSAALIEQCKYKWAASLYSQGKYSDAQKLFEQLGSYEDAPAQVTECKYMSAKYQLEHNQYENAYNSFLSIRTYKDSEGLAIKAMTALIEASSSAEYVYDKVKDLENDIDEAGGQYVVDHLADIYSYASSFVSEAKFDKAADMFSWVAAAEYEDSAAMEAACKEAAAATTNKAVVAALRSVAHNDGVKKAMMRPEYFEVFLLGKWLKGSTQVMYFEPDGDVYHLTFDKDYIKKPTSDEYYNVRSDGSGEFYTCKQQGENKQDWFKVTILDGTHINVYVYKTDKTYELKRK